MVGRWIVRETGWGKKVKKLRLLLSAAAFTLILCLTELNSDL